MKTKYTMMMALLASAGVATAQEVDDMYFNSRDRMTHNEAANSAMAIQYAAHDQQAAKVNPVNPSDSYTGRGMNPEYSAQQKNGAEIIQGNPDYFLAGYAPKDINSNLQNTSLQLNAGCGCNNMYAGNGFGYPYGNMYSPYGFGSPYGMGGYPYGMGMGYPYGMGGSYMSMSMMYGMGYGMTGMYGGMYGNPYYGYGSPYGYPAVYSPMPGYETIQTTYGIRAVRGSAAAQAYDYVGQGGVGTNGRNRVAGNTRNGYYDKSWRNDPNNFTSRSYGYGNRTSSYGPASSQQNGYSAPGRTRSFDSFGQGAGSRSFGTTGTSGGASGGGGRSRGRN